MKMSLIYVNMNYHRDASITGKLGIILKMPNFMYKMYKNKPPIGE